MLLLASNNLNEVKSSLKNKYFNRFYFSPEGGARDTLQQTMHTHTHTHTHSSVFIVLLCSASTELIMKHEKRKECFRSEEEENIMTEK